jgi:hypothetical protein
MTFVNKIVTFVNRPLAKILESSLPNPPLIKGRKQDLKFPLFISYGVDTSLK